MNPKSKQQLESEIDEVLVDMTNICNDCEHPGCLARLKSGRKHIMQAFESFHTGEVEKAVREAIPKADLQEELQQAAIQMTEQPASKLEESEKWEWYGYLRALRDIAYFARLLGKTDIQERLEERLKHLHSTESDKS